jgi:hypothetical protein
MLVKGEGGRGKSENTIWGRDSYFLRDRGWGEGGEGEGAGRVGGDGSIYCMCV